jgi:beta-glucosidase
LQLHYGCFAVARILTGGCDMLRFPDGFFWGAATAAHQIEGFNVKSDWWRAEQAGLMPYRSEQACDSWSHWRDDIGLLQQMGLNAYRLSLEWARIEPEQGQFDQAALDVYLQQLQTLKAAGIEPMITLHHFTSPAWLADLGGWANPDVVGHFVNFTNKVVEMTGDLVRWWVTFNEPSILAFKAYIEGSWPPHQAYNLRGYTRLLRHAVRAHHRARRALRSANPDAQVSMAFAIWPLKPLRPWSPIDRAMVLLGDWLWQGRVLQRALPELDWIGVNYYSRTFVGWPWTSNDNHVSGERTDFGWEIYPEGLREVLNRVGHYGKPVIVTENGISDADDDQRAAYIVAHVRQMLLALEDGVDLRGYMHWTLLDNYEWAEGFEQRFGLATRDRELRPSARVYETIARANGLPDDALGTFSVT